MPNNLPTIMSGENAALEIVVDQPTYRPGLGYDKYVKALAAVVQNGAPAKYTVGIYGPWGVGKSSILSALELELKGDDLPVATFDAWRYARNPNVLVPLLHEIDDAVSQKPGLFWKSIFRGVRAITAEMSVPTPIGSIPLSGISNAVAGVAHARREPLEQRRAEIPHYRLKEIGEDLTKEGKRIIVLVDDLDRCPPGTIVDILEAIHVLTDVQGFVFVMALDYDVLMKAIKEQYPSVDAAQFIEKIVQIPFSIPEVDRSAALINDVVPQWQKLLRLSGEEAKTFEQVVHLALRTNPRQVKRLVNSMLVAQFIVGGASTSKSVLLAVIGLQLRWPAEYRDVHAALVANPDNDLFGDFDTELRDLYEDKKLKEYLDALLPGELSRTEVFAAMKFSQTTASASDPSVSDTDERSDGDRHTIATNHENWFKLIQNALLTRGATYFERQQYVGFKNGTRAFLRADGYERVGVRLYFPDWMQIDPADVAHFGLDEGARGKNFSRTLRVQQDTKDVALKYVLRAFEVPRT